MRELVFLPDRDGYDELSGQAGFVRLGADAAALGTLAERLRTPEAAAHGSNGLLWRSSLTLALLMDVWADCGTELKLVTVDASASLFASWVLAARPAAERDKPVHLLVCERNGQRALLGVADALCGLRLPATLSPLAGVVPERASWIDRENGMVSDPVPYLTERDRRILADRITLLKLDTPEASALLSALAQADAAEENAVCSGDEAAVQRLELRLQAVHGLADFEAFSVQRAAYAQRGSNPLMQCLAGRDALLQAEYGESAVYLWNGVPFARTSSRLGLTGVGHPEEQAALASLAAELGVMAAGSVKWNHETGTALKRWADERRAASGLLPEAKERILALAAELRRRGQQVQSAVTLMWPWDANSGAVQKLLLEALGESWMAAAAQPFSDRLTKLTGHVLGDTALNTCCACSDGVLLPPLSRELAACAAAAPIGSGLALDAMRFQPQEDGGITASFLLRGNGEVRMMRSYSAGEILVLNEADSPSAAVWPCLPMASWRAYHVFSRGGAEVAALCGGEWKTAEITESAAAWRCLRLTEYPACLSLSLDGLCLGALPNMLPAFETEPVKPVTVAIDMGSCETAVAFASGEKPSLIEGQELTRRLVMPQNNQADVFLSGLRPRSIVPTAVMLTGAGEGLFTGGSVCLPETLEVLAAVDAAQLRTGLKWRADAESVRARRIFLHQIMLGAALTAIMDGAKSIAWRATVADEMGDEGREALLTMLKELSAQVAEESGLPLAAGAPAITWAEESAALCTSLRLDGVGRGSYVSVDLGGGSTKMHLWMQGQQRPLAGAVVLEGMQSMLVKALQETPNRLLDDFADCGDEQLLQAVVTLTAQLNQARTPRQMDKTGLMLDRWLDMHRGLIIRHMGARMTQQRPTWMQSVLLECCAAVIYTVGLMLRQVCDNTMINHRLPEDITVCLTGRGAWLLETLTPQMRGSLQNLARISLRVDHPVRFVTLKQAALPAQCVATGLAVAKDVQRLSDAPPIRTRESFSGLMRTMVQKMCAAFPAHLWQLHEGLMDWQGSLTVAGEETIRRVATQCYGDGEDIPASVLAFVRTLRSEMILPDSRANGGAFI